MLFGYAVHGGLHVAGRVAHDIVEVLLKGQSVAVHRETIAHVVATKDEVDALARDLKQTVIIDYTRENFATPVTQGEVFGTMTYYPTDGGSAVTYQLVASRSIARREDAPKSLEEIEAETYADPNPFPPFSLEVALVAAVPLLGIFFFVRFLFRKFHKGTRRSRRGSRVPKPGNRYFR